MEIRNNLVNAVIEIEDGVEYLINEKAAEDIYNNVPYITVTRLVDGFVSVVPLMTIQEVIKNSGVIDHLSKNKF